MPIIYGRKQVVHVPAHTRQGHPVAAYDRLCGQKHTAKEAAEKNQGESIQENVNQSSWNQAITTKENQYLFFDGKELTLYENGNAEKSWNAVSGKPGFQHPNYQDLNRDNFSIHGGKTPGSSGCIDLTKDMQNFTQWFEKNGYDVILHVKY